MLAEGQEKCLVLSLKIIKASQASSWLRSSYSAVSGSSFPSRFLRYKRTWYQHYKRLAAVYQWSWEVNDLFKHPCWTRFSSLRNHNDNNSSFYIWSPYRVSGTLSGYLHTVLHFMLMTTPCDWLSKSTAAIVRLRNGRAKFWSQADLKHCRLGSLIIMGPINRTRWPVLLGKGVLNLRYWKTLFGEIW